MGWRKISRDYFKSDPPSPLDLENAISAIEDEIARTRAAVASGSAVITTEEVIRDIALASGMPAAAEMVLALEAVEHAFARLAGRAGLAGNAKSAAALLVLRELMHHLQIDRVVVRAH